jgi:site-specific DNA recombinase
VIVTRIDRLSRHQPTLRKVVEDMQECGCVFVSLDENIDLSTSAGKYLFNTMASAAEHETDRLSERIRWGKEYFRKMKRASHAPFGYRIQITLTSPIESPSYAN